jgi:hypothetical protein
MAASPGAQVHGGRLPDDVLLPLDDVLAADDDVLLLAAAPLPPLPCVDAMSTWLPHATSADVTALTATALPIRNMIQSSLGTAEDARAPREAPIKAALNPCILSRG